MLMRIQLLCTENTSSTCSHKVLFNKVFTMYVQWIYKDTWGYLRVHCTCTYQVPTRYIQGTYSHITGCWWLWIQLLPEDTSCTGTCEGLLRSHDGVRATPPLLRPGDGDDGDHGVFNVMVMVHMIHHYMSIITFVALIGWGTMRPPVECAEAAEEVGKGR